MRLIHLTAALCLCLLLGCATPAPRLETPGEPGGPTRPEADTGLLDRELLLGDAGGARPALEDLGITLDLSLTSEVFANLRGGSERGAAYQGNIDLTLEIDFEKLGLVEGGRLFAYGLHNHHTDSLSARYLGDLQTASNIDAPRATRLFELWYEQRFGDRLSILLGRHDLNSEFAVTETGGLFLNSSFGIGPDLAANAPFSIFPAAGLAARVHLKLTDAVDLRLGAYDGDPGDPTDARESARWRLSREEGALLIGEVGVQTGQAEGGLPGAYKLGAWFHTARFDHLSDVDAAGDPERRRGNFGIYAIADQMLYREAGEQGLSAFLQIGGAPRSRNEVSFYLGVGLKYRGLLPGRDDDELGLALARAWVSSLLAERDRAETVLELTYRAQLTPWMSLQPNLQWIVDPGADPDTDNALAAGARIEIGF